MLHVIKDVCQLTNLKQSALRNAIKRKEIPAKKINGVYYVTDETIRDLLKTPNNDEEEK